MKKLLRTVGTIVTVVTTAKQVINLVQGMRKKR
ncbi:hypothetical protein SABR111722_11635 [Saccharibacillus brassicae]